MRPNIEGGDMKGVRQADMRIRPGILSITANLTLTTAYTGFLAISADNHRTLTLPAVADSEGLTFIISNASSSPYFLTVVNASGTAIGTIGKGGTCIFICDGVTWRGFGSGGGELSTGPGAVNSQEFHLNVVSQQLSASITSHLARHVIDIHAVWKSACLASSTVLVTAGSTTLALLGALSDAAVNSNGNMKRATALQAQAIAANDIIRAQLTGAAAAGDNVRVYIRTALGSSVVA